MSTRKFAVVGVIVGLVAIATAMVNSMQDSPSEAAEIDPSAGVLLDASTGIAPLDDVVEFFQRRVAERPNDYISRTQLARALSDQARQAADLEGYERAETIAREALVINPTDADARIELASALHSQHQVTEALAIGQILVRENPASRAALYAVSDASFELGNYALAARTYARLETTGRNAAVVSRLARLAAIEGDNDRAASLADEAEVLSGAFSLRPNGKAFYPFQSGHFRFEAGDVEGAIASLDAALAIDPEHAGAIEKLASIHAAAGNLNEAIDLYEFLIALGPAADLHGAYADVLRATGRETAADEQEELGLALAEATIERFPAERRHLTGYYFSRDPVVALRLAEADIIERQDVGGYDTLAWALHLNGRHVEAEAAIDEVFEIGTNTAMVHYHAGAIAASLGETDVAVDHLEAALAINERFAFGDADDAKQLLSELRGG